MFSIFSRIEVIIMLLFYVFHDPKQFPQNVFVNYLFSYHFLMCISIYIRSFIQFECFLQCLSIKMCIVIVMYCFPNALRYDWICCSVELHFGSTEYIQNIAFSHLNFGSTIISVSVNIYIFLIQLWCLLLSCIWGIHLTNIVDRCILNIFHHHGLSDDLLQFNIQYSLHAIELLVCSSAK